MEYLKAIQSRAEVGLGQVYGTELEKKVRAATSPENWPAPQSALYEIAQATFDYNGYREIMPLVWSRLTQSNNWRIVFKCLVLIEALLKHGSERVVSEVADRQYELSNFTSFHFHEGDKDRGAGIRDKSKDILEMMKDPSKLKEIRAVAEKNKDKYVGVSNSGGTQGYGGSGRGSGGDRDRDRDRGDRDDRYNNNNNDDRYGGGGRDDDEPTTATTEEP